MDNFALNPDSGLVCLKQGVDKKRLACDIATSRNSYLDEFSNICYNLYLYASVQSSCNANLYSTLYDCSDCSFNYFKVCVNDVNYYGPTFNKTKIVSVITLDYILKWEAMCLHQFKFADPKTNADYNYTIKSLNNKFSQTVFSVNATLDCLAFEVSNCLNKNAILGKHIIDVTAEDSCGRSDTQRLNVYVIESCRQKGFVTINFDSRTVLNNLHSYTLLVKFQLACSLFLYCIFEKYNELKRFFAELASALVSRDIDVIVHKVYDGPDEIDTFMTTTYK